jgi:signal peptidase I
VNDSNANSGGHSAAIELDPELKRRLAETREKEEATRKFREQVNRERRFLIPVLVFVALLFPNFGRAKVLGSSMQPQYKEGDALVILKTFRVFAPLQVGDVIVLKKQEGKYQGEELVKRVAFIQNAEGNAPFPKTVPMSRGDIPFAKLFPFVEQGLQKVSPGRMLVVGDNLAVSVDSRDPDVGAVSDSEIVGKVLNR